MQFLIGEVSLYLADGEPPPHPTLEHSSEISLLNGPGGCALVSARCPCSALPHAVNPVAIAYRGTSPTRKRSPTSDPSKTSGIGLRQGPRGGCRGVLGGGLFLLGEVPLYTYRGCVRVGPTGAPHLQENAIPPRTPLGP